MYFKLLSHLFLTPEEHALDVLSFVYMPSMAEQDDRQLYTYI